MKKSARASKLSLFCKVEQRHISQQNLVLQDAKLSESCSDIPKTSHCSMKKVETNTFCSICGLPARLLTVNLEYHLATCRNIRTQPVEMCLMGERCFSMEVRHYRLYAHTIESMEAKHVNVENNTETTNYIRQLPSERLPIKSHSNSDFKPCVLPSFSNCIEPNISWDDSSSDDSCIILPKSKRSKVKHNELSVQEILLPDIESKTPLQQSLFEDFISDFDCTNKADHLRIKNHVALDTRIALTDSKKSMKVFDKKCNFVSNLSKIDNSKTSVSSELYNKVNKSPFERHVEIVESYDHANGLTKSSKKKTQTSILSFFGQDKKVEAMDQTTKVKINENPKPNELDHAKRKGIWRDLMNKMTSKSTHVSDGPSMPGLRSVDAEIGQPKQKRQCPFYKKIPGTQFVVDAFNYGTIPGINAYFLTHFHYDHYIGLKGSFDQPIYCSSITASLTSLKIGVKNKYLNIVPLGETRLIHRVQVTALDANHCPGSVMFLFQLPGNVNILHVGDFRATPAMESYSVFSFVEIDRLFLDTTYLNSRYSFPSQEETIHNVVSFCQRHLANQPQTLIVCGAYTIGKEKVFVSIAEAINCKIWAAGSKRKILNLLEDEIIKNRLIENPIKARVHVMEMRNLKHHLLSEQLLCHQQVFSNILAFKPSGWEFSGNKPLCPVIKGKVTIVGVPYSEHSSFLELRRFVQFLRPKCVIPTVNVGKPESRDEMKRYIDTWLDEVKKIKPIHHHL